MHPPHYEKKEEERPELSFSLATAWRHSRTTGMGKPGRGPLPRTQPGWHLDLGFLSLQNCERCLNFLWMMQDLIRQKGPKGYVIWRTLLPGFALTQVWGLHKLWEADVSLSEVGGWSPQAGGVEEKMDANRGTHEQSTWNRQNWNPENGLESALTLRCFQTSHFNDAQPAGEVCVVLRVLSNLAKQGRCWLGRSGRSGGGRRPEGAWHELGELGEPQQPCKPPGSRSAGTRWCFSSASQISCKIQLGLHSRGIVRRRESWRTEFQLSSAGPLQIRQQEAPNQLGVTTI